MTSDWTANGVSMPRFASAPATASDTPRSAKVEDMWELLLAAKGDGRAMRWGDSTDPIRAIGAP